MREGNVVVDRIASFLEAKLDSVYCDTCEFDLWDDNTDSPCDYCHRKSMGWTLSKKCAEELANDIYGMVMDDDGK